jgi:hypothetical protein
MTEVPLYNREGEGGARIEPDRNVQRFRSGLVSKAHGREYLSPLGLRVREEAWSREGRARTHRAGRQTPGALRRL